MKVVKQEIKKELHAQDINMGVDYLETLDAELMDIIHKSVKRAKENARKTVFGRDL